MHRIVSILLIIAFLAGGFLAMRTLRNLRKAPPTTPPKEARLTVEVVRLEPEDVPVVITGHAQAQPLDIVAVAPQVAGNVVAVHPDVEVGRVIPAGEVLFRIDPRDYEAAVAQARAQAEQARSALGRLRSQSESDKSRLDTLARTKELAQAEFERVRGLFEESQVGTRSNVEKAETAFNQTRDALDLLRQNVGLYPFRIQEQAEALALAEASLDKAALSLERTEVRAEFTARVKEKKIEAGQYVAPGAAVLTLANDSVLELAVPIDSRDAADWLDFEDGPAAPAEASWFSRVKKVPCRVVWTESERNAWQGVLDRVKSFDEASRTVTVAVRVDAAAATAGDTPLPMVEGMFCRVEIPGRTMAGVYRLPRWAVSFQGDIYLSRDGRLEIKKAEIARSQGTDTFLSGGVAAGELAVVTRLVNPLPNALLEYDAASIPSSRLSDTLAPAGDETAQAASGEAAQ